MANGELPAQPLGETAAPHLSLVIPAYNESRRIGFTLEQTQSYLNTQSYSWEILVVDDGSTDDTVEVVENTAQNAETIQIIRVSPNRGKGHALKVGMLKSTGQYVGFMDADYKTDITCIEEALERLEAGKDIVIGSRKISGAEIDVKPRAYRRMGSLLFNKYIHLLLPILSHYKDTQCGFKFYTQRAAHEIFSRSVIERFMFDAEALYLAHKLKFTVEEMPVRWSSDHDTRTRIIESIIRNTIDLVRIRLIHKSI